MTDQELKQEADHVKAALNEAKAADAEIKKEMYRRFSTTVKNLMAVRGKDYGSTTFVTESGVELKTTVPKNVTYDQDGLRGLANQIPYETFGQYFDVKIDLKETKYKELPEDIRAEVDRYRTVEAGDPRITFKS